MLFWMRKRKEETGNGRTPASLVSGVDSSGRLSRCSSRFVRRVCWVAAYASVCLVTLSLPELVARGKKSKVSKTVTGAVLDEAENPVVGATVKLNDIQTGKKMAISSQEGGRYQFSDLDPTHDYEVQASFQGASSEVRKVSSLDDRRTMVIDLTLSAHLR